MDLNGLKQEKEKKMGEYVQNVCIFKDHIEKI
jgi:hypothetical protein